MHLPGESEHLSIGCIVLPPAISHYFLSCLLGGTHPTENISFVLSSITMDDCQRKSSGTFPR